MREDYSEDGDAWDYFTHDQARSRAYRWGEDGLAGISDDQQLLCFALALWNGKDPILKERLFGLTNSEGNHGEDVKEYYFYLDSTPTHSYMKYLYKYPQAAFPTTTWSRRTGGVAGTRWSTSCWTRACSTRTATSMCSSSMRRQSPDDMLDPDHALQSRAGSRPTLHVLPTLWFRNTWSWWPQGRGQSFKPVERPQSVSRRTWRPAHPGSVSATSIAKATSRSCSPRTKPTHERLFGAPNASPYVKDGINDTSSTAAGRGESGRPAPKPPPITS